MRSNPKDYVRTNTQYTYLMNLTSVLVVLRIGTAFRPLRRTPGAMSTLVVDMFLRIRKSMATQA
ncbi:MAG: hypothetical protein KAY37_01150 [Phycisphaerae bacterium]|nr:hypothetical protein [Phycisphaerae bacterium]